MNLATRMYHRLADEPWLALLRAGAIERDYHRQLEHTYGFEAPLEAALAYTPHLRELIDLRERSRAGLLATDLISLGLTPKGVATIPQCTIAPFADATEGLGWLYVAERATLLHDSIGWQLAARFPAAAGACTYLSMYHGVARARWSALGEVLDEHASADADAMGRLEEAARAGFRALIGWHQPDRSYAAGA